VDEKHFTGWRLVAAWIAAVVGSYLLAIGAAWVLFWIVGLF
jgi:hypothetical protein